MDDITLESALIAHGISGEGISLLDNARESGVCAVCYGCGYVLDSALGRSLADMPMSVRSAVADAMEWHGCPACRDMGASMARFV